METRDPSPSEPTDGKSVQTGSRRAGLRLLVAFVLVAIGAIAYAATAMSASSTETFKGRYVLRHADDFAAGKATFQPMLRLDDGTMLELDLPPGTSTSVSPGAPVVVRGTRKGGSIQVADGSQIVAGSTTTDVATTPRTKRVAIVLFNFSNNTSQPYTPAQAAAAAFTNTSSAAAYYAANSWNSVTLKGDVYGWYTIPDTTTSGCNYSTWAISANKLVAADGFDLSTANYENIVYEFPSVSSCGFSGVADMPGRKVWLNGAGLSVSVMSHELGHNFGTHHASTYTCTDAGVRVPISANTANCTRNEYGDPFSVMGNGSRRNTSSSLGQFGWLPAANRQTVTADGDYQLAPLYSSGGVQALRIPRSSNTFLTLEFRQPNSPYDTFSSTDPVVNGVTARITGSDTYLTQSLLIDTTPSTTSFTDAALGAGRTLFDPVIGVSVTTLAVSPSGATVRVAFGSGGGGSGSDTTAPGQPGNLKATPLDTSRVGLSWTASTDNVGVAGYRVYRGSSLLTTVTSTSYTDTGLSPATTYSYQVVAFDAAGNASPAATASATMLTPDTQAPTAPTNLAASVGKGKKVTLSWTASSDNVGVAGYRVYKNGSDTGTASGTSYTDTLGGKNPTATYYVVAFDAAGNVSPASGSVVVNG